MHKSIKILPNSDHISPNHTTPHHTTPHHTTQHHTTPHHTTPFISILTTHTMPPRELNLRWQPATCEQMSDTVCMCVRVHMCACVGCVCESVCQCVLTIRQDMYIRDVYVFLYNANSFSRTNYGHISVCH